MNNFNFLKPIDKNLYEIISDAENLYRDEYFEQCITQTRRFGENVCKAVLGNFRTTEKTFDDMLATLKDRACHSIQEKEFIDDLYFLKREGNNSVHAGNVKNDGIIALECLQRAFEIALNYTVHYRGGNSSILKLQYDIDVLATGKKSKSKLTEVYEQEKLKQKKQKTKTKKEVKKSQSIVHVKNISISKILLKISSIISLILILTIYLLSLV